MYIGFIDNQIVGFILNLSTTRLEYDYKMCVESYFGSYIIHD